tara:strand:- start:114 stop:449 length:336 start_codon:yes stop_codon:yes gene_type:complete
MTTPEVAKPPQKASQGFVRAGAGCAPRVAFCVMIEDDPVIEYASEKTCKKSLPEMEALVQFHLTAKLIPGPYMIDTLCGDEVDLKNYEIYLNLLAEQMRVQLEGTKKGGGV